MYSTYLQNKTWEIASLTLYFFCTIIHQHQQFFPKAIYQENDLKWDYSEALGTKAHSHNQESTFTTTNSHNVPNTPRRFYYFKNENKLPKWPCAQPYNVKSGDLFFEHIFLKVSTQSMEVPTWPRNHSNWWHGWSTHSCLHKILHVKGHDRMVW